VAHHVLTGHSPSLARACEYVRIPIAKGAEVNDDRASIDAQRRELQRRVFSASSESSDARAAARQLQLLDSRRLREASDTPVAPAVDIDPAPQPPIPAPTASDDLPEPAAHVPRRAIPRLVGAVLLALAVGVAVGLYAGSPTQVVSEQATSRPLVDSSGALALFDRPQAAADLPDQALPGTVIGESIRAIGDPFFQLYIGRNAANMVCLFAVQPRSSFAMSCVTIDEFPSTGVRLEWSGEMSSVSADGSTSVVPSTMRAIWRPDGSLDLGGGPR